MAIVTWQTFPLLEIEKCQVVRCAALKSVMYGCRLIRCETVAYIGPWFKVIWNV